MAKTESATSASPASSSENSACLSLRAAPPRGSASSARAARSARRSSRAIASAIASARRSAVQHRRLHRRQDRVVAVGRLDPLDQLHALGARRRARHQPRRGRAEPPPRAPIPGERSARRAPPPSAWRSAGCGRTPPASPRRPRNAPGSPPREVPSDRPAADIVPPLLLAQNTSGGPGGRPPGGRPRCRRGRNPVPSPVAQHPPPGLTTNLRTSRKPGGFFSASTWNGRCGRMIARSIRVAPGVGAAPGERVEREDLALDRAEPAGFLQLHPLAFQLLHRPGQRPVLARRAPWPRPAPRAAGRSGG